MILNITIVAVVVVVVVVTDTITGNSSVINVGRGDVGLLAIKTIRYHTGTLTHQTQQSSSSSPTMITPRIHCSCWCGNSRGGGFI